MTRMAWCMPAATREQARDDLIDRWDRDRQARPTAAASSSPTPTTRCARSTRPRASGCGTAGDLGDDVRLTVERGARSFASGDRVMFLQNERGLGVKNGTLGTIEQVSERSMSVRTDDGRSVSFDLKDYDRIDHGYAATIHKAQGMTVDRTHVLATPGLDAHGSYVALSRHRDGMDLHYGRDDFADREPARPHPVARPGQGYGVGLRARRSGAGLCRAARDHLPRARSRDRAQGRAGEGARHVRRLAPAHRGRARAGKEGGGRPGRGPAQGPHQGARAPCPRRGCDLRDAGAGGRASPEQVEELQEARKVFEEVRPHGSHDAEAAYKKNPELAQEAATGRVNRAIRALQLETEIRTDPARRADRFVDAGGSSTAPASASIRRATCPATRPRGRRWATWRRALNAIRSLNPSSQAASETSASGSNSGRSLGRELAFNHGIDLGRGRGIGL